MYGDDAIEWWCWSAHYPVGKLQDVEVVGVTDDRFALISEMNEKCNIAVKTPVGMTDRF